MKKKIKKNYFFNFAHQAVKEDGSWMMSHMFQQIRLISSIQLNVTLTELTRMLFDQVRVQVSHRTEYS